MAAPRIPRPLPPEGFSVLVDRIDSSYRALGFLPGYSRNSLSPKLILHATYLEVKIMQTSYHEYTSLREVGYEPEGFFSGPKLLFSFTDDTEYSVTPASTAILRDLLAFCQEGNFPLSAAAQQAATVPQKP
ncbi:hypothetical protein [Hymenobacter norwichensis]|uniref:hypothetical protein n=1 Tax=Hymenobacter norwichensis TaxID=223903 RepID=UPI0003B50C4E|nr:hypothetical protein [Hymenobacter norwichensis]